MDSVFYDAKDLDQIPMGSPPTRAPNADGVGESWVFRQVEKCPTQMLYRQKFVSIRHDGALDEEYAVSSTMLVVNEVCL